MPSPESRPALCTITGFGTIQTIQLISACSIKEWQYQRILNTEKYLRDFMLQKVAVLKTNSHLTKIDNYAKYGEPGEV